MQPLLAATVSYTVEYLIGLAIWLLVMVWIYNIAKRKGRHPVGWVILGFFFSIITLVVILLMPSKLTTDRFTGP